MTGRDDGAMGAFTIADLWKPSIFTIGEEDPSLRPLHQFGLDSKDKFAFGDILKHAPFRADYQDIESFRYGALEEIPQPESVAATSELDSLELGDESATEDVWLSAAELGLDRYHDTSGSWESFYDAAFAEPGRYLSDLGPAALDAMITRTAGSQSVKTQQRRIFQQQPALVALKALGMGCSSWLFEAPDSQDWPGCRFPLMTISGLSPTVTESIATNFMRIGASCRDLRKHTRRYYESKHPSSTLIALAATVSQIVGHILFRMSEEGCRSQTILETQLAFRKPAKVLNILQQLVASLEDQRSDVGVLSTVFEFICRNELNYSWARPLLLAILGRVSRPWLSAMNCCLGLSIQSSCDRRIVASIQSRAKDRVEGWEDSPHSGVIPTFVTKHIADVMLETCNSISMLKEQNKGADAVLQTTGDSGLEWNFCNAVNETSEGLAILPPLDPFGQSATGIRLASEAVALRMDARPVIGNSNLADDLHEAVQLALSPDANDNISTLTCPLALAPMLSFASIAERQHRSIGRICLRMLFHDHSLRKHLTLQHRFHLFGDGLFAARLSQALFASDMSAVDNRRDYSQSGDHGLRLGDRNVWPPGGSELRLVLMGILNESYYGSYTSIGGRAQELPGNLSFGIRQLSESEIEAILDPHSLHALDFLRLQYTASTPLDAVFTDAALQKYDAVFKLLLRVSRLLAVTSQMAPRRGQRESMTSARFRIVATRFMETLSSYFLQSAIAQPWSRFEARIDALDASLNDDLGELGGNVCSVMELRLAHDAMLDTVLFGLFLRHRQGAVMQLLEDVFALILQFARIRTLSAREKDINELYDTFRAKASTFVAVCRGLSGKKSYMAGVAKDAAGQGEGSGIEQLVLRLDMNGWWSV